MSEKYIAYTGKMSGLMKYLEQLLDSNKINQLERESQQSSQNYMDALRYPERVIGNSNSNRSFE